MKNNLKVIITVGLPASGKSTWSKNYITKNQNFIRVNRDDFRLMLKNQQVCENNIENLITKLQDNVILTALNSKLNVIVDNTNLKEKYINHIIELVKYKADVEYMLFDTPYEKCIEYDNNRTAKVGEKVIERMNNDFKILKDTFLFQNISKQSKRRDLELTKPNPSLKDCVIIDFDNTLAFMSNRSPYDWKKCINDYPNEVVIKHANMYKNNNYHIVIMSGRDEICREECIEWLNFYNVPYDELLMRKKDDFRKDNIIKKELYQNHIENKYNVMVCLDDRNQVVNLWRNELNLNCFQVNESPD